MKVSLYLGCKLDSSSENVVWGLDEAGVDILSTPAGSTTPNKITFTNKERFVLDSPVGVLPVQLSAAIDINKINYMVITDFVAGEGEDEQTGRKYYCFVDGVERVSGELYNVSYSVDVFHTFAQHAQYANAVYDVANDRGHTKTLIYDNTATYSPPVKIKNMLGNETFTIVALFALQGGGYTLLVPPNTSDVGDDAVLSYALTNFISGIVKLKGNNSVKGSVVEMWSVPSSIITKTTEFVEMEAESEWSIPTSKLESSIKNQIDNTGIVVSNIVTGVTSRTMLVSPVVSNLRKHDENAMVTIIKSCLCDLDPTYNYFVGNELNYEPIPLIKYDAYPTFTVNIRLKFIVTHTGVKILRYINDSIEDITSQFVITPTLSDAVKSRIAEKQMLGIDILSSAISGAPTPKYDSVTTRTNNPETTERTFNWGSTRNPNGTYASGKYLLADKAITSGGGYVSKTTHVLDKAGTLASTGLALARTGASALRSIASYRASSMARQYGIRNQADGVLTSQLGIYLMSSLKMNRDSINESISLFGFDVSGYREQVLDLSSHTDIYRFLKLESVTVLGLSSQWVDALESLLLNGVRVYYTPSDYLSFIEVEEEEVINNIETDISGDFNIEPDSWIVVTEEQLDGTTTKLDKLTQAIGLLDLHLTGAVSGSEPELITQIWWGDELITLTQEQSSALASRAARIVWDGYGRLSLYGTDDILIKSQRFTLEGYSKFDASTVITGLGAVRFIWGTPSDENYVMTNAEGDDRPQIVISLIGIQESWKTSLTIKYYDKNGYSQSFSPAIQFTVDNRLDNIMKLSGIYHYATKTCDVTVESESGVVKSYTFSSASAFTVYNGFSTLNPNGRGPEFTKYGEHFRDYEFELYDANGLTSITLYFKCQVAGQTITYTEN